MAHACEDHRHVQAIGRRDDVWRRAPSLPAGSPPSRRPAPPPRPRPETERTHRSRRRCPRAAPAPSSPQSSPNRRGSSDPRLRPACRPATAKTIAFDFTCLATFQREEQRIDLLARRRAFRYNLQFRIRSTNVRPRSCTSTPPDIRFSSNRVVRGRLSRADLHQPQIFLSGERGRAPPRRIPAQRRTRQTTSPLLRRSRHRAGD